jgi:hypothetical protein
MKRKSTTPRSYFRQLAEPIPRTAALLIPRRPAAERGAATRSSLDAIPPIIDVTEAKETIAAEPEHTRAASSIANVLPSRRTKSGARSRRSQVNTPTSTPAAHAKLAKQSSATAAEKILQSSMREHSSMQTDTPPAAIKENPQLQPLLAHIVSAHATSPLLPTHPQATSKTAKHPDISVHIGTIEVRVPAPPARSQQTAPATRNPRNSQHAVPGRASEKLSRSLAWSHGLVQG